MRVLARADYGALELIRAVADYFGVTITDLKGPRRKAAISLPRQVLMYLLYNHTGLSQEGIGYLLGKRHHTTVMYGIRQVEAALGSDHRNYDTINKILDMAGLSTAIR